MTELTGTGLDAKRSRELLVAVYGEQRGLAGKEGEGAWVDWVKLSRDSKFGLASFGL